MSIRDELQRAFGVYVVNSKARKEGKMGSLAKKDKDAYALIWKEALPGLVEQNVRIQKKALNVIEEKIGQVSAAQAATIYGILHDKCQMILGQNAEQNATVNMYFGGDIPSVAETASVMQRVVERMHKGNDAEFEVVEEEKAAEKVE